MLTINLFDAEFPTQPCSVNGITPRLLTYVRERREWDGISVWTDRRIYDGSVDAVRSRLKVAWLLEGRCLRPAYYERIGEVVDRFDLVLTTDPELLARDGKYHQVIRGGAWTPEEKWDLYPKTRGVSLLLSDKCETPGHKLRHEIAARYGDRLDVYRNVPKAQALKDYRFTICVEACYAPNWFSEHLLDALAYGCIPLYWGCPNLGDWFNDAGVLEISDPQDVGFWLEDSAWLTEYYDCTPRVRALNLEAARQYAITDDWIAEHVYLPLLEVAA